jgi:hypothetical protein
MDGRLLTESRFEIRRRERVGIERPDALLDLQRA